MDVQQRIQYGINGNVTFIVITFDPKQIMD
jgi:hypothetical protein